MEQDRAPPVFVHNPKLAAKPLLSYRVIVELIGATTTKTGLTVRCELDDKSYPNESSSRTTKCEASTFSTPISTANGTTQSALTHQSII